MAVLGGNRLLFNPGTPRIRQIVDETVGRGQELEVRILIGAPAELILMACVSMPNHEDKLEVAQSMAGDGLAFSGDALPFPLSTEYVMKARIIPQYEQEGPFGEVGGVYSVRSARPVCLVDELLERSDPVFHSISAGVGKEHLELLSLGARYALERIKRDVPEVLRYDLPAFGGDRLAVLVVNEHCNVELLAARLWEVPVVRGFIIVNNDVGSGSAQDLLWALLQRARNSDHFTFTSERHPLHNTDRFVVDATVSNFSAWENRRVNVCR
jgi:UbiD family decarboxylase